MQNWDDELDKIMKRKMRQYQNQGITNSDSVGTVESLNKPVILTDNNFAESVKKFPLLIVDFWAPWCGPCRMVSPIIEQLANELAGKATFGKLNVDENPTISSAFGIQSIPTIIIFKNGQPIDGFMGAMSKPQMMSKILQYTDKT